MVPGSSGRSRMAPRSTPVERWTAPGFDDIGESSWPTFLLTTYSHPLEEMMDKLTDVILDPVQYEPRPQFVMEGDLKIRASTDRGRPA
jgi:DNA-binding LacI/PurR family transcriptional regulator